MYICYDKNILNEMKEEVQQMAPCLWIVTMTTHIYKRN